MLPNCRKGPLEGICGFKLLFIGQFGDTQPERSDVQFVTGLDLIELFDIRVTYEEVYNKFFIR